MEKEMLMTTLNLPFAKLRIKKQKEKDYVFDILRRQYVRLTPEEWVRQHFVNYLIENKKYPRALLANEVCIKQGKVIRRCDTILYDKQIQPQMIFEYKAPSVLVTSSCFDQILCYNSILKVAWIVVSNGLKHYGCRLIENKKYSFIHEIPDYQNL